jgi:hypothetical protein
MYALPNDSTYTEFNGSTDYFSIPNGGGGSDFNVGSNNFSVVMLITPTSLLSSTSLFGKYLPAGNKRQWLIQQTAVGIDLLTSSNGIAASVLSKAGGGLAIGKTSLITVTYTAGTGASAIYVDAASAATGNTATSVYSADGAVEIGSNGGGANPFNGRIHFLSYTNHGTGPVITQAQHDAMLIRIKDARSLPVKIGNSYENKKLYVEFESKCEYSQTGEIASDCALIELSGNTGTASATQNRLAIQAGADGKPYVFFWDTAGDLRYVYLNSALTTWNKWKTHKVYLNLSDLSLSTYLIDGTPAATFSSMTGAEDLDLTNTLLRIGQRYSGTSEGDCAVRNVRLRSAP